VTGHAKVIHSHENACCGGGFTKVCDSMVWHTSSMIDEFIRARATFRRFTKTPPDRALLVHGQQRFGFGRPTLPSFQAQRRKTIAPFDGQLDRPRRSRLRHGHFDPQFLSGTTYRGIHGMRSILAAPRGRVSEKSQPDSTRWGLSLLCYVSILPPTQAPSEWRRQAVAYLWP
jgi:hypothetical protein